MCRRISRTSRFVRSIEGQTMPEYALVLALVASASALLFPLLGSRFVAMVNDIAGLLAH